MKTIKGLVAGIILVVSSNGFAAPVIGGPISGGLPGTGGTNGSSGSATNISGAALVQVTNIDQSLKYGVDVFHGATVTHFFGDTAPFDAAQVMVAGDKCYIGPGSYNCSNFWIYPANCAVYGAGRQATILRNWFTNGVPSPLIAGSDNIYLASLQITNMWADPNGFNAGAGSPSSCFGTHPNTSGVYTNAHLRDVIFWGGSDTMYNRATSGEISYVMEDSELHGPWDIGTAFGAAKHRYTFRRCNFDHRPTASHNNNYDILVSSFSADVRWKAEYCTFYMSNGIAGKTSFYLGNEPSTDQGASFSFCKFTNAVPSGWEWNVDVSNPLEFYASDVKTETIGDDLDPDNTVIYRQIVANSIKFSGNRVDVGFVLTNTTGGIELNGNLKVTGFTNAAITDAIPWHDANGKASELTVGSGLTLTGNTLTAAGGGGITRADATNVVLDVGPIVVGSIDGNVAGTVTPDVADTGQITYQVSGNVNSLSEFVGVIDGSDAGAGRIGEYIESVVSTGSGASLTTGTGADVTSISLTAGDWDVEGNITFQEGAGTVVSTAAGVITTTSATVDATGFSGVEVLHGPVGASTAYFSITLPRHRISITTTTTVYLATKASFSVASLISWGQINARRVR